MLEVIKFIFKTIADFINMLFTIDIGFTNLGTMLCIIYIFLPLLLIIINFFKRQIFDELDDLHDTRYKKEKFTIYQGKHEKR